jgi:hypothetical protein
MTVASTPSRPILPAPRMHGERESIESARIRMACGSIRWTSPYGPQNSCFWAIHSRSGSTARGTKPLREFSRTDPANPSSMPECPLRHQRLISTSTKKHRLRARCACPTRSLSELISATCKVKPRSGRTANAIRDRRRKQTRLIGGHRSKHLRSGNFWPRIFWRQERTTDSCDIGFRSF